VPPPLLVAFAGGRSGAWAVTSMETLADEAPDRVPFVDVAEGAAAAAARESR
jgi:hypothetical protein